MPMPNDYKDFSWRPNDNSSLTNHRYDLEAEKWVKSVRSAKIRYNRPSMSADLGAILTIFSIPLLLLGWVILIPVWLLREITGYNIKLFSGDEPTGWIRERERNRYKVDPRKFPKPDPKYQKPSIEEMKEIAAYIKKVNAGEVKPKKIIIP